MTLGLSLMAGSPEAPEVSHSECRHSEFWVGEGVLKGRDLYIGCWLFLLLLIFCVLLLGKLLDPLKKVCLIPWQS